jgi:hypothetical protein
MAHFGTTDAKTMRSLSAALINGKRGNLDAISEGVSWLLKYQADIVEAGYVTPSECAALHLQHTKNTHDAIQSALLKPADGDAPLSAAALRWLGPSAVILYLIHVAGKGLGWI